MVSWEPLGNEYKIAVTKAHKFGTDAFLLASFAAPRRKDKCCDLGSGCGIIPSLWYAWGLNPTIAHAVELQPQACNQMAATVAANGLEGRLVPLCCDLKELGGSIARHSLDVVTCNPPYKIAGRGVPCPDDTRLTARHEVACTLEDVCRVAAGLLRFGGRFCLCQRPERLPDIMELMRQHGIEPKKLRFVQQRPDKAPWLVLVEGKKSSKPFLQVEAPLIVANEDGSPTKQLMEIYRCGGVRNG